MPAGRRPLPWIKLWFDILNDVKMNRLSIAEKGCWMCILLLAGQAPERGKLLLTDSEPMTMDDIATALHLTPEERPTLESCVSKLVVLKSLRYNDRGLEVTNFKRRQEVYPSDVSGKAKTPRKLRINSELTPTEVEVEEDVEKEEEKTPKGARKRRADPVVNEIFDEVRKFMGYPEKTDKDPIPSYGKEGQAVKRMLTRGFTREEIMACWKSKVSQRGGEFVSMTWVNQDISVGGEPLPDIKNQGGIGKEGSQSGKHRGSARKATPRRAKVRSAEEFGSEKW